MNQRQQKPPQAYGMFSNAALLAAAVSTLEQSVVSGSIADLGPQLQHINGLVTLPRKLGELPFVQIGFSAQSRLIGALTACLDPDKVKLEPSHATRGNAKDRQSALKILMEIDAINDDANMSTMSSVGHVGRAIPTILLSPHMNNATLEAYHERLTGWPRFIKEFGDAYETALDDLYNISIRRGHGDEMTMNWVKIAKRQLHTNQFMGAYNTGNLGKLFLG